MHIWLSQSLDISKFNCLHIPSWIWWAAFIHNVCVFNRIPFPLVVPLTAEISGVEICFWTVPNLKARIVCAHFPKKSSNLLKLFLKNHKKLYTSGKNARNPPLFQKLIFLRFFCFCQFYPILWFGKRQKTDSSGHFLHRPATIRFHFNKKPRLCAPLIEHSIRRGHWYI